jgi:uncharacterized protein (DUF779 family)
MTDANAIQRVVATKAALEAIRALQAASGRLMFFMSGGCCDGSLPICLQAGELITGPADLLLGQVGGCDFWLDAGQDAAWGHPQFELDVEAGTPEGFSLEHWAAAISSFARRATCVLRAGALLGYEREESTRVMADQDLRLTCTIAGRESRVLAHDCG